MRRPLAVIACGALAGHLRKLTSALGLEVEVHVLSALLHDRPGEIAPTVRKLASSLALEGKEVAVAYADCGTYGALDELCEELGLRRLPGLHCYDLLAGPEMVAALFEEEPGTYLLTDFLVRTFSRTVAAELGLDRRPELASDYFGNYSRIIWLTEDPSPDLEERAAAIASLLGLPLERRVIGEIRLAVEIKKLVGAGR